MIYSLMILKLESSIREHNIHSGRYAQGEFRVMIRNLIILATLFCLPAKHCWSGDPITIDGLFDDWALVPVAYSDISGDGIDEDFAELKITNDNDFLFLKFSFRNSEHLLQDLNNIRLYIDTDNDTQSGLQINEIGAELEWCFGCREGVYHSPTGPKTIRQAEIVLRSAPTITAKDFELALSLRSVPMTSGTLQMPDTIVVVLATSDVLDLIPDQPGGVLYAIDTNFVEPPGLIPLIREHEKHVRVLTYNTLRSGLLDANRQDRFQRIIKSLDPDIMAFQEQAGGDQVKSLMASWLQESELHSVELGNNNLVVSRYPVLNQALITASGRTMAVLLQTESVLGTNLLLINSHLACCANNASRQHDADEIIMVLRNWRAGSEPFPLPDNTPIIHLGDFNLVGSSQQLRTLTEGDIADELNFGSDFYPDWDNTALTDLFSRHTSIRMGYTWRNDNSSFNPGKLDYILFTDSAIEPGNHFVLNTLAMSDSELDKFGLLSDDTNIASDHLPRIMDISSVNPVSVPDRSDIPHRFQLFPAYPNPFNPTTNIRYSLPVKTHVSLKVYDMLGHQIKVLVNEIQTPGSYTVGFDATGLASGIYTYRLKVTGFSKVQKFILLK